MIPDMRWLTNVWDLTGFPRSILGAAGRHNLSLMAAGVAFFAMLALVPAITALISLYGAIADPAQIALHLDLLRPVLPDGAFAILESQTDRLLSARPGALGLASALSLMIAVWSSRAGVTALVSGLGVINGDASHRSLLGDLAVAHVLTLLLMGVGILSLSAVVVAPAAIAILPDRMTPGMTVQVTKWGIALVAVLVGIGALYRLGPARAEFRPAWISTGSVAATLMWVVVSVAFSAYVGNFASYNQVYGSLGAVVALLMWFYLSAFVILLGAEINAELRDRRARAMASFESPAPSP
jgi:membrane protein